MKFVPKDDWKLLDERFGGLFVCEDCGAEIKTVIGTTPDDQVDQGWGWVEPGGYPPLRAVLRNCELEAVRKVHEE